MCACINLYCWFVVVLEENAVILAEDEEDSDARQRYHLKMSERFDVSFPWTFSKNTHWVRGEG